MSGNATTFAEELGAFGVEVESEIVAQKRDAALEILEGVTFGNPVGQPRLWKRMAPKGYVGGYSRGQWQMTSGDPADGEVAGIRSPSQVLGDADQVDVDLERTTWITNNAPYIGKLEYAGHSTQAPDGWVRAVVERARARYGAD